MWVDFSSGVEIFILSIFLSVCHSIDLSVNGSLSFILSYINYSFGLKMIFLSALGLTVCLCVCVESDVSLHNLFLKTPCWLAIYPVITELLFT